MNAFRRFGAASYLRTLLASASLASALSLTGQARVLDNFDDNIKTDWSDFSFRPDLQLGVPIESNGQLRFEIPPVGGAIFGASQKVSEVLELREGRTIEMRVDIIESGGKDSFAVLAFIPQGNSPGTLEGYGLAKSTTDVLITKGINKYFVSDNGVQGTFRNTDVTLVLTMTAKDGSVTVNAKVLDKLADNAVMWERTIVDTPDADSLVDGEDNPKAPWITKGYFTLYCYEDFDKAQPENPYKIYYDNAKVVVKDEPVNIQLDNFDDNTKTDWTDFSFRPDLQLGIPVEADGQLKFQIPPIGQAIFSASQKTSRIFELREAEKTEFHVDIIEGGKKDSFAVLAFIPQSTGPGTLAGYGLAKSTTDILITKGINKYFVADSGAAGTFRNDNVRLSLTMEEKDGSVIVTARVLDLLNDNAVMWERTIVDTPEADPLVSGKDDPKEPWITKGYFTLYCYADFDKAAPEDPYKIYYDNAGAIAPPPQGLVAPLINEITPVEFGNFLAADSVVSFKGVDDKDLADNAFSIVLNGVTYTSANGLTLSAAGPSRTASLVGKLVPEVNYTAVMNVTDSEGVSTTKTIYFDTFTSAALVIEAEDYNFNGGAFFDNPAPIARGTGPEDGAYSLQTGVRDVDFSDTRTSPRAENALYRPQDAIRMDTTRDLARAKYIDAGGADAAIYDYDVGDIAVGEWMNYTRNFPSGAYEVYLRESLANMSSGESVLEQVIGDPAAPDQLTKTLGTFLGARSGFQYRNFALTDGSGKTRVRLNLQGTTTLRLRHLTADAADGARLLNYIVFQRVGDVEFQRAQITSVSPAPDSVTETLTPSIQIDLQNRDTSVNPATISLELNGKSVNPTLLNNAQGSVVSYTLETLPVADVLNTATVSFKDNQGTTISSTWSFTITYKMLNPANRAIGTPGTSGMRVHVVQAPAGPALANSLIRAEDQISANSTIERAVDVTQMIDKVNFNKIAGRVQGHFGDDIMVPGIDPTVTGNGDNDFTTETVTYLQLEKGIYRFGVNSDDGYKLSSGKILGDITGTLASHSGGPADETVDFVVIEPGLYPFRLLWYERGGAGYAELFSVDRNTGDRTLINDLSAPNAIKAYTEVTNFSVTGSGSLTGNYAPEGSVAFDSAAKTITVTVVPTSSRLFKVQAPEGWVIKSVKLEGNQLVISYQ